MTGLSDHDAWVRRALNEQARYLGAAGNIAAGYGDEELARGCWRLAGELRCRAVEGVKVDDEPDGSD